MPKYQAAEYLRLSYTADRENESDSISNQKKLIEEFLKTHTDIELVSVYVDDGYSGILFERPAMQELLDMVRAGKINCIIVKDFSRFGRNSIEVGYFMERVFPLYGIRFISVNDDFDSERFHGDTGGINVAFKYLVSEFYSRDLSIKYKSAKMEMQKRELVASAANQGFSVVGISGDMQSSRVTDRPGLLEVRKADQCRGHPLDRRQNRQHGRRVRPRPQPCL